MDHRTLGIIIVVAGGLVLYSAESSAWIISALAVGLGTSSGVMIIASMLVSPLMGPL